MKEEKTSDHRKLIIYPEQLPEMSKLRLAFLHKKTKNRSVEGVIIKAMRAGVIISKKMIQCIPGKPKYWLVNPNDPDPLLVSILLLFIIFIYLFIVLPISSFLIYVAGRFILD